MRAPLSFGPLISVETLQELAAHQDMGLHAQRRLRPSAVHAQRRLRPSALHAPVRVLDIRWYLSGKRGEDEYARGHLPHAQFVSLDRDLSSPTGCGPGRHPLPTAEAFAAALSRFGITATTRVVAYDDAGGAIAARFWWLMRHFGLPHVAVLDGGIGAWERKGGALSQVVPAVLPAPRMKLAAFNPPVRSGAVGPSNAALRVGGELVGAAGVVDKRAVNTLRKQISEVGVPQPPPERLGAAKTAAPVLLDARATERFEGQSEPVDARPGHIPGAQSHPFQRNLTAPGGTFLDRATLADRFAQVGVGAHTNPIVCYCGSGVTACHNLLALALIGREDALLYEGSWSDWAADDELPAACGPA